MEIGSCKIVYFPKRVALEESQDHLHKAGEILVEKQMYLKRRLEKYQVYSLP